MEPFDLLTQYLAHRDALSSPLEDEARPVEPPTPEPVRAEPVASDTPSTAQAADAPARGELEERPDPQRKIA